MVDLFDKFPDNAEITPFNNDKYYGLSIHWSMKGCGFGQLVFAVSKETGEAHVDKECMDDETCAKIIDILKDHGKLVTAHGFHEACPNILLPNTILDKE